MLKWPLRWKTSIQHGYLTVKIHSVIGCIDYTLSLLKPVLFCCLCIRTDITNANVRQELFICGTSSKRYKWFWTEEVTFQC